MKQRFIQILAKLSLFVIILGNLTACGTVINFTQGDYSIYGGVRNDFSAIQEGGVLGVFAVIDLPLSFVFDTLLLPVSLSQ